MIFHSTKDKSLQVDFQTALLTGIAPDGGLYVPEKIPDLTDFVETRRGVSLLDFNELAFTIAKEFIDGEIPDVELKSICADAYDFPIPLTELENNHAVLELFHGPTAAFKDFAARFMARCTSYFLKQKKEEKTILVATSGDTGGAVGNGFLGQKNVKVYILFPKGRVSPIQEKQLTTMGQNVQALEINGNFDDCQRLVKEAFLDPKVNDALNLMSANSINIGRIIPQSFYYAWTSLQLESIVKRQKLKGLVFSVPSGNFGNITGGLWAQQMGFPIHKFIAANNANHSFYDYWKTGSFTPVPSVSTISNAMDIGHPNNYYRINYLFHENIKEVREKIWATHFTDEETKEKIKETFEKHNYIACPHTAVALLGTEAFQKEFGEDYYFVSVSTAHPAKFPEVVEKIIGEKLEIPSTLQDAFRKKKDAALLPPSLEALQDYLCKIED